MNLYAAVARLAAQRAGPRQLLRAKGYDGVPSGGHPVGPSCHQRAVTLLIEVHVARYEKHMGKGGGTRVNGPRRRSRIVHHESLGQRSEPRLPAGVEPVFEGRRSRCVRVHSDVER